MFFSLPQPGAFVGDARADVYEVAVGYYTSGTARGDTGCRWILSIFAPDSLWIPRYPFFNSDSVGCFFGRLVSCHGQEIYWWSCPLDGGSEMTIVDKLINLLGTNIYIYISYNECIIM